MTTPRLAALAIAAAAVGTQRGRGCPGPILITLGAGIMPEEPMDPERDRRIRDRLMAELGHLHAPTASRNGHSPRI